VSAYAAGLLRSPGGETRVTPEYRAERNLVNERAPVQKLTLIFGIVFLALGILGFIPGLTTHYGDMSFAGDDSSSELLGVFQVSIFHNIVHLLFGVAGLSLAKTWEGSRNYLIGGGVFYLLLWLLGLANGADWIPANDADDWLHLALGVTMIAGGILTARARPAAAA
jgi:uncharacterized protein DUF4383